jgi:hypothetical protein
MHQRTKSQRVRPRRGGIVLALAISAAFFVSGIAQGAPTEAKFKFNPPDGTIFISKGRSTQVVTTGLNDKRTNIHQHEERVQIKKTPTGFTALTTPTTFTYLKDGVPPRADDWMYYMQKLSQRAKVTEELDQNGKTIAVKGLEEAIDQLKREQTEETPAFRKFLYIAEKIESLSSDSASGGSTAFEGRSAKIGATWSIPDYAGLPGGEVIKVTQKFKIVGHIKCGGKDCLRVQNSYKADQAEVRDLMEVNMVNIWGDAVKALGLDPRISSAVAEGHGECVIDPATMLIYSDSQTQSVTVTLQIPQLGKVNLSSKYWSESSNEYLK